MFFDMKYIWNNSFLNCGCRWKWRMIIASPDFFQASSFQLLIILENLLRWSFFAFNMFFVKSWEMSGTMQKFYHAKWFIWIVTQGLTKVSKLARITNNLVMLNAVLNLPSWSWVLHSPNVLSCTRTTKSKYRLQKKTMPIHKLKKKLAFNSDNSSKKIYKSYPRLLHFQLKL